MGSAYKTKPYRKEVEVDLIGSAVVVERKQKNVEWRREEVAMKIIFISPNDNAVSINESKQYCIMKKVNS